MVWKRNTSQAGQALLIVILIMVVALSLVLAVASRSIVNLRNTRNEEETQKAYQAAEAGIEKALASNASGTGVFTDISLNNNASIKNVDKTIINGTTFLIDGGSTINKDNGSDIWFVKHDSTDPTKLVDLTNSSNFITSPFNLTLWWHDKQNQNFPNHVYCPDPTSSDFSNPGNQVAAIEVILVTDPSAAGKFETHRYVYDPCDWPAASARQNLNNMTAANSNFSSVNTSTSKQFTNPNNVTLYYSATITGISYPVFARVIPLYSSTVAGVDSAQPLPDQGTDVTSLGASGDTQRKLNVFNGYSQLPAEFFYLLLSPVQS